MSCTPPIEGAYINKTYKIHKKIGDGSFGSVFIVLSKQITDDRILTHNYALKISKDIFSNGTIDRETKIYRKMKKFWYIHTPALIDCGFKSKLHFIVISLAEGDLEYHMNQSANESQIERKRLILLFFVDIVNGVEKLHDTGYVHRDIKPKNILISSAKNNKHHHHRLSYIIDNNVEHRSYAIICDFGLSRKIIDHQGNLIKPRKSGTVPFRGTYNYTSIHYQLKNEFSRGDDLVSVVYTICSVSSQKIFPWSDLSDKNEILKLKFQFNVFAFMGKKLPEDYLTNIQIIYDYVNTLDYFTRPRYEVIVKNLDSLINDDKNKDKFKLFEKK